MQSLYIIIFLLLIGQASYAQHTAAPNLPSIWMESTIKVPLPAKFTFSNDLYVRRKNLGEQWQQFVVRPYVTYAPKKWVSVGLGYTFVESYQQHEPKQEHHILEQVVFKHALKQFKLAHRFRLEQRFEGQDLHHRLRYKLKIKHFFVEKPRYGFFFQLYDEFHLPLRTDNPMHRAQNWAYLGAGVKIPHKGQLTLGYMGRWHSQNQWNHIIDVALVVILDFKHPKPKKGVPHSHKERHSN